MTADAKYMIWFMSLSPDKRDELIDSQLYNFPTDVIPPKFEDDKDESSTKT
jgi:hypothetical protein